jgi:hypothetical protein
MFEEGKCFVLVHSFWWGRSSFERDDVRLRNSFLIEKKRSNLDNDDDDDDAQKNNGQQMNTSEREGERENRGVNTM